MVRRFGTAITVPANASANLELVPKQQLDTAISGLSATYQPLDQDLTDIAAIAVTNDSVLQAKAGAWSKRTMAQLLVDLAAVGTTFQPLDSDLTTIAGLTATTDSFMQSKSSAWTTRTLAQVATDLAGQSAFTGAFQPLDSDLTTVAGLTATTDNFIQSKSSAWSSRTPAQVATDLAGQAGFTGAFQPLDADLTTIAGLTATTDNIVQSVGSAWASRTPAQLKTTLALAKGDVGLGNVDNTSDTSKPVSTATQTALDAKEPSLVPTASKTAGYTAVNGDYVLCDATGGGFTITLPAAAANRFIGVKKTDSSANLITITRAGSDTIGATAATSVTLALQDESVVLMASGTNWVRRESQLSLSPLDTRFQASDADLTTIAGLTATTDSFMQSKGSAWSARTVAQVLTDLAVPGTTFQPLDSDLTAIAGLTATTDNFLQSKSSAWASRTIAQVRADLNQVKPWPPVNLTAGATPALNAALGTHFRVTMAITTTTIGIPSNPTDGQVITIEAISDATPRTLALNTGTGGFRFGSSITALTIHAASKTDYVQACYNSTANKWDVIGYVKGF